MSDDVCSRASKFLSFMKEAVKSTKETGRELGFLICENNEELHMNYPAVGDRNKVNLGACVRGKPVGSFHTHPKGTPFPSLEDIAAETARQTEFACIGNEETIVCYNVKTTDLSRKKARTCFHPECIFPLEA